MRTAIALAIELNAELLLIDERRARAEADKLGLRITGLLGVLVEAKQKGFIVAVKPVMDGLIATAGFRVADALYTRILHMVGYGVYTSPRMTQNSRKTSPCPTGHPSPY